VAKTNLKAKGQAFVVFDNPESAQMAVEEVHGFEIFDKPMKVALARMRSDATVKLLGNDEELEQHKRRRMAEKDKKMAAEAAEEQLRLKRAGGPSSGPVESGRPAKSARLSTLKSTNPAGGSAVIPDEYLPPNKILFVQNLPEDYEIDALTSIFGRFEGFREVRLVPGRRGIAFVEYDTEQGAITAKENTAGMAFGKDNVIKVTYQRQ
jgi:RNA recognition motif-containing protein